MKMTLLSGESLASSTFGRPSESSEMRGRSFVWMLTFSLVGYCWSITLARDVRDV